MGNINNWIIGMVAIIGGCSILALLVKSCEKNHILNISQIV